MCFTLVHCYCKNNAAVRIRPVYYNNYLTSFATTAPDITEIYNEYQPILPSTKQLEFRL